MSTWEHRQLIRRVTPADLTPEPIPESPARDSRPVADPNLQLAQLHALADDAANALAQMHELAERMRFGRDVISSIDDSGRALATAMLAVTRGPLNARCGACAGTGRIQTTLGGICAACRGSGLLALEGSR